MFMCNKCTCACKKIKCMGLFSLIFLIIALIIFITINNPINQEKNILVAIAKSRR